MAPRNWFFAFQTLTGMSLGIWALVAPHSFLQLYGGGIRADEQLVRSFGLALLWAGASCSTWIGRPAPRFVYLPQTLYSLLGAGLSSYRAYETFMLGVAPTSQAAVFVALPLLYFLIVLVWSCVGFARSPASYPPPPPVKRKTILSRLVSALAFLRLLLLFGLFTGLSVSLFSADLAQLMAVALSPHESFASAFREAAATRSQHFYCDSTFGGSHPLLLSSPVLWQAVRNLLSYADFVYYVPVGLGLLVVLQRRTFASLLSLLSSAGLAVGAAVPAWQLLRTSCQSLSGGLYPRNLSSELTQAAMLHVCTWALLLFSTWTGARDLFSTDIAPTAQPDKTKSQTVAPAVPATPKPEVKMD